MSMHRLIQEAERIYEGVAKRVLEAWEASGQLEPEQAEPSEEDLLRMIEQASRIIEETTQRDLATLLAVEGQTSHQIWIDEANEIQDLNWFEHDGETIRYIPPAPARRITIPEGFVLMGGQNSAPPQIGEHHRGIIVLGGRQAGRDARRICGHCGKPRSAHVRHGPGCREWVRGYREGAELGRFDFLANRPQNTPKKLEERRKVFKQWFKPNELTIIVSCETLLHTPA